MDTNLVFIVLLNVNRCNNIQSTHCSYMFRVDTEERLKTLVDGSSPTKHTMVCVVKNPLQIRSTKPIYEVLFLYIKTQAYNTKTQMHISAYQNCQAFYDKYITPLLQEWPNKTLDVVDIGSFDVNGTLKPVFHGHRYTGVDMSAGPNVDIVCMNQAIPLEDGSTDIVVSSSCLEHDECFWESFVEMCRLVKPGGYVYINAPSAGFYHACPQDCWRFYPDSWKALEKWARRRGYAVNLLEAYTDSSCIWKNSVGIFQKDTNVASSVKL